MIAASALYGLYLTTKLGTGTNYLDSVNAVAGSGKEPHLPCGTVMLFDTTLDQTFAHITKITGFMLGLFLGYMSFGVNFRLDTNQTKIIFSL